MTRTVGAVVDPDGPRHRAHHDLAVPQVVDLGRWKEEGGKKKYERRKARRQLGKKGGVGGVKR